MNDHFDFKRFRVGQAGAAMKVGTDGVLLGAWADLESEAGRARKQQKTRSVRSVLDIGTGTGVIALMAAQRCETAIVDAVEIDPAAARQAQENARNSPWADRIHVHHVAVQDFEGGPYDRILSNPPFFVDSLKAPNASRTVARHADALSFADLAAAVDRLLAPDGTFSVVYPMDEAIEFQCIAAKYHLFLNRRLRVRGTPKGAFKRALMEFSRRESPLADGELTIENASLAYTEEYIRLTRDFYLKF